MSSQTVQQGQIQYERQGAVARVTIANPSKFNAMTRAMWRELRAVFERIHAHPELRCVLIAGQGAHFCAGGDISEYAAFRFQQASLRDFHESDVWGALQSMLDCDLPIVAQISGNCMGAGVEIASCCDIRLAAASAQFGAPIARLGFPMAPREAALVAREVGLGVARQMLLAAEVFKAADMKACGFLSQVLPDEALAAGVQAIALRIAALAPQAARLNKQTFRALNQPLAPVNQAKEATNSVVTDADNAYAYAESCEHREGITAFLEKRKPAF
ncbi:MAG: enoyl-CoA hydratase/isomerase family protein [Rhodoferax sp.]